MAVGYAETEEFLTLFNGISPEKRATFRGRIKHFQRLGWPPGTNSGKGGRAVYGSEQILLLAVTIEILQFGVTPERILEQLSPSHLGTAFKHALEKRGHFSQSVFYVFSPSSLAGMQASSKNQTGFQSLVVSLDEFQELVFKSTDFGRRRFAAVNLTCILDAYLNFFGLSEPTDVSNLAIEIDKWGR